MTSLRILFLVPDLFGAPGGIARYSRLVCKALGESPLVEQLDVVALNDSLDQSLDPFYLNPQRSTYTTCGGSKLRCIRAVFAKAGHRHQVYLTSLVNLLPVLLPLHLLQRKRPILIGVAHGIDVWNRLPWQRRAPLHLTTHMLAVSHYTRRRMIASNDLTPSHVTVLHNCLDPLFSKINVLQPLDVGPPGRRPTLLTVSRLDGHDWDKGHAQVIRALQRVREQIPDVSYHIVGDGELTRVLKDLAAQVDVADAVTFLGRVSDEALRRLYEQADLFVMPSSKEGFGLVFLEAMAHSKAVVAGNKDATVEVVQDGKTGHLVDPADVDALAAAIIELLRDSPRRDTMGREGRRAVEARFSFGSFQNQLLTFLTESVQERQ